jgi:SAM-dependent methyltransferase
VDRAESASRNSNQTAATDAAADAPSSSTSTNSHQTAADAPSLSRELRGWLRFLSPLSRYSATFYRTDARIADQVVAMALGHARPQGGSRGGSAVFDLGCGDGAIMTAALRAAAAKTIKTGVRGVVGYELCPELAEEARRRCAAEAARLAASATMSSPPFSVVQSDAAEADLSDADVVVLYMSSKANAELLGPGPAAKAAARTPSLSRSARTLRPGSVVASLGFPVDGWDAWKVAERAVQGSGGGSVPVFLFVVGGGGGGG